MDRLITILNGNVDHADNNVSATTDVVSIIGLPNGGSLSRHSSRDYRTINTVLWRTAPSPAGVDTIPDAPYLLARTSLPDNRQGIHVYPGAYTNLIGSTAARAMAQAALNAGLQPRQERLAKPLHVSGIGKGSQEATWEIVVPIAVTHSKTGIVTLHEYRAPVAGGTGAHLPPLFSL